MKEYTSLISPRSLIITYYLDSLSKIVEQLLISVSVKCDFLEGGVKPKKTAAAAPPAA